MQAGFTPNFTYPKIYPNFGKSNFSKAQPEPSWPLTTNPDSWPWSTEPKTTTSLPSVSTFTTSRIRWGKNALVPIRTKLKKKERRERRHILCTVVGHSTSYHCTTADSQNLGERRQHRSSLSHCLIGTSLALQHWPPASYRRVGWRRRCRRTVSTAIIEFSFPSWSTERKGFFKAFSSLFETKRTLGLVPDAGQVRSIPTRLQGMTQHHYCDINQWHQRLTSSSHIIKGVKGSRLDWIKRWKLFLRFWVHLKPDFRFVFTCVFVESKSTLQVCIHGEISCNYCETDWSSCSIIQCSRSTLAMMAIKPINLKNGHYRNNYWGGGPEIREFKVEFDATALNKRTMSIKRYY